MMISIEIILTHAKTMELQEEAVQCEVNTISAEDIYEAYIKGKTNLLLKLVDCSPREEILKQKLSNGLTFLETLVAKHSSSKNNIKLFERVLSSHQFEEDESKDAERLLKKISSSKDSYKFLNEFVIHHKQFDDLIPISTYCDVTRSEKVNKNEMSLMLNRFDLFLVDEVKKIDNLTSESAFLLHRQKGLSASYKAKLIPLIKKSPFLYSMTYEIEVLPETREEALSYVFNKLTEEFNPIKILKICDTYNITTQQLEVMVTEQQKPFKKRSVKSILSLGVSLSRGNKLRQLVGEKIAFNCEPAAWKELNTYGFNFDICATDLLVHLSITSKTTDPIKELLKYTQSYDEMLSYSSYSNVLSVKKYLDSISSPVNDPNTKSFVQAFNNNRITTAYNLLKDGVIWENIQTFKWVDNITFELASKYLMKKGIKYSLNKIEDIILRCTEKQEDERLNNYRRYYSLSCGFAKNVKVYRRKGEYTIQITSKDKTHKDILVSFKYDFTLKGKYKGLDLISKDCTVLDTNKAVKMRRAELQLQK